MTKTIRVALLETDPYARQWMALLLARDWGAKVVISTGKMEALTRALEEGEQIHILLIDEQFLRPGVSPALQAARFPNPPSVICLADRAQAELLAWLDHGREELHMQGCLIKEEIANSLGWALAFTTEGRWVMTPGVASLFSLSARALPRRCIILDGRRNLSALTPAEREMAQAAILFSMERRDVADELNLSLNWIYTAIHELYEKIGVFDLLEGEVDPAAYLGQHPAVLDHFHSILAARSRSKKAIDKETLAFHLLCTPEIIEETA